MLLDVHCHIDGYGCNHIDTALKQIEDEKILSISNSMDYHSYKKNLEISEKCKLVVPIFGVHPWNAPYYEDKLESIKGYIEESLMLGEVGLDYHFIKDDHQHQAQQKVFEFFLNEAKRLNKIVIVHSKGAEEDVLRMLRHYDIERAIIHWYSGPIDTFSELVKRNYRFTIGFMVNHSDFIKVMARRLPGELILTETDNPGGVKWYAGEEGLPLAIDGIVKEIALARKAEENEIVEMIWNNFINMLTPDEKDEIMKHINHISPGL